MIDYRVGDTRDLTGQLDDGSIELVASSPPFLALRSYLPDGHESKHAEIGSEPDPATFLDTLLALTADWGRVLTPYGSIAIELGDTFSSEGGTTDNRQATGGGNNLAPRGSRGGGNGWPRPKSLALIPQLYACSLAYGRNILTGQPSPAGQWLVRNVIVWHRPNPAVGALGDKFRPSTSYIVVATRNPKRWFDLTAVRSGVQTRSDGGTSTLGDRGSHDIAERKYAPNTGSHPAGAPPLDAWFDHDDHDDHDTWTITTQPSRLSHYAMWPAKLAERLILSMCPAEVCRTCGEPRRRIEDRERHMPPPRADAVTITTLGWTDCGHDNYRAGVVLDPFCGTGTTLCVADLHGRDGIGFDIDPRNAALLEPRMAGVRRNLHGVTPELPGQMGLDL